MAKLPGKHLKAFSQKTQHHFIKLCPHTPSSLLFSLIKSLSTQNTKIIENLNNYENLCTNLYHHLVYFATQLRKHKMRVDKIIPPSNLHTPYQLIHCSN